MNFRKYTVSTVTDIHTFVGADVLIVSSKRGGILLFFFFLFLSVVKRLSDTFLGDYLTEINETSQEC